MTSELSIKVEVGDLKVIHSGDILIHSNIETNIKIAGILTLRFVFIDDPERQKGDIQLFGENPILKITCYNCNNIFGQGIPPTKIGLIHGKELWLGFIIKAYPIQNSSFLRTISYVIYEK